MAIRSDLARIILVFITLSVSQMVRTRFLIGWMLNYANEMTELCIESDLFQKGIVTKRQIHAADSPRNFGLLRDWLDECLRDMKNAGAVAILGSPSMTPIPLPLYLSGSLIWGQVAGQSHRAYGPRTTKKLGDI